MKQMITDKTLETRRKGKAENKGIPAKRVESVTVKLIREKSFLFKERVVNSPNQAYELIKDLLEDKDREVLMACFLDTKNQPIATNIVSIGSLNSSIIHPREIFKVAILCNSDNFILFHNHPSGVVEPSSEDISATSRIKECGKLMGITLTDHIIVGNDQYFSMLENGLL